MSVKVMVRRPTAARYISVPRVKGRKYTVNSYTWRVYSWWCHFVTPNMQSVKSQVKCHTPEAPEMFIDLNILLPTPALVNALSGQSKKKGKQKQQSYTSSTDNASPIVVFSPNQIVAIEARIDLLVHGGWQWYLHPPFFVSVNMVVFSGIYRDCSEPDCPEQSRFSHTRRLASGPCSKTQKAPRYCDFEATFSYS